MAIERIKPYEATESVLLARSYADLARVLHQRGRHDAAEPLARWALAVTEKVPGKKSESLCKNLELLAEIQLARRRPAEAEPLLRRLVEVRSKALGSGHPDMIPAVEGLAEVLAGQGRLAEAEPVYRRALALRKANHAESLKQAEETEKMASLLQHLITIDGPPAGPSLSMLRRMAEVQRLVTQAQAFRESSAESVSAAVTTEGYSSLLRRSGRVDEAEALEARAKAIRDAAETRAAKLRAAADR